MTIEYTASGKFIHKQTYGCTWCGKKGLFWWERTQWRNPMDGDRTNFLCADCATQLELEVTPWPVPLPPHSPKTVKEVVAVQPIEENRRLEL
jgi:hypothetical protein